MKLVEILAKELDKWPEGALKIVQNYSHNLEGYGEDCGHINPQTDCWNGIDYTGFRKEAKYLASDYRTAIVTREMWQAEREQIAKPGKKANADGWIRHRGGKCPVEAGAMVEVRNRAGDIALTGAGSCNSVSWHWSHDKHPGDIMAYKIRNPAEETADEKVMRDCVEKCASTESADDLLYDPIAQGPLQWRDRTREIDAEVTQRNEAHRQAIEALEEERVSLIQRLEGEGLQLLQGKVCGAVQAVEDMSDPRSWKVGDCLRAIGDCGGFSFHGQIVKVLVVRDDGGFEVATEDEPDYGRFFTERESATDLEFHSRPSA